MVTKVKVYVNCDDVYIVWKSDARVKDCRGFALYCRLNGEDRIVSTWVGFEGESAKPGTRKPSTKWPIQKFMWCDYMAKSGDRVSYQVVPMVGSKDDLKPAKELASDWTEEVTVSSNQAGGISAYFNRGIVATQWLARRLGEATSSEKQKKLSRIIADVNDRTRNFLSGELRLAMLKLFDEARTTKSKIYAVLYELDDPELETQLLSLGKRAAVILANGSGEDQNIKARDALKGKVNLYNRMLPAGRLAHNKFLILCDSSDRPRKAWTGSTNWTKTGLCTQANNGILIDNPKIASLFKAQWDLLKGAKNGFPAELIESNSKKKNYKIKNKRATVWFTPVREEEDLNEATALINQAKQGILFLMFNPGPRGTLLNAIIERNSQSSSFYDPNLYIHGVLNQDPSTENNPVVGLFHRGEYTPANFDVLLPEAIDERLSYWIPEIKKKQNAWAMVHSKVIVLDPFGPHPVVMTGSHNLGPKASSKNDDNLVIVENDPDLAAAYAVNIMSIYNQYRWRHYRMQSVQPNKYGGLHDNDRWQDRYFKGPELRELNFWLGQL